MIIVAHRGYHKLHTENTIDAFKAAIGKANAIEMDIHRTNDNKLIIFHNPYILIDNKKKFIENTNLNEILKANPKIPLFEDVLKTVGRKIKFVIEIKSKDIEKEVLNLTKQYLTYNDFAIISFKDSVLGNMKKIDSKIRTGLIIGPYDTELGVFVSIYKFLRNSFCINYVAKKNNIDFFGINYRFAPLYFNWARRNKKKIFLWTVNGTKNLNKFLNPKYSNVIEGLITNTPNLIKKL
jgi:glycerophosphoryl diester phosphodiesterase